MFSEGELWQFQEEEEHGEFDTCTEESTSVEEEAVTAEDAAADAEVTSATSSADFTISFTDFETWWKRTVTLSPVTIVTSESEFDAILADPFPGRAGSEGALVVLEIGFTFCRPCKAFEPKYERFAKQYAAARFIRVNGNENNSTVALCRDRLKVKKTPTFYFFRRGELVFSWTGANADTFKQNLEEHYDGDGAGEGNAAPATPQAAPEAAG